MNQLGIGDLTHGVSAQGAIEYYEALNTNAISSAITALQNTESVKTALQGGWQGAAEATFEKNLDNGVNTVISTLETIKKNIESLISDLVEDLANQDKNLVEEENIINF